jgi:GTP cyclohydrolase FolE2
VRPVTERDLEDVDGLLDAVSDMARAVPIHQLPIAEAGIGDQDVRLEINSFVEPGASITVSGLVDASAALPRDRRGVHMSRLVQAIDVTSAAPAQSLAEWSTALVLRIADTQNTTDARAALRGKTIVRRVTPVTGLDSPDSFGVSAQARLADGQVHVKVGLDATIITACPCTLAYSSNAAIVELSDVVGLDTANEIANKLLTFTHSQRATVRIVADAGPGGLDLPALYRAVTAGAHVVHELLKRPDEHFLVRKAHERPQFTEDVVRDVAAALVLELDASTDLATVVRIESVAIESIHAHSAASAVEGTLLELRNALEAP